jgi:hypothetical protein
MVHQAGNIVLRYRRRVLVVDSVSIAGIDGSGLSIGIESRPVVVHRLTRLVPEILARLVWLAGCRLR